MNILYTIAALGALMLAQAILLSRYALRALTYRRKFSRAAVFSGETAEMIEVLRNGKPLPLPWLRAESRMSPHLQFGGAAEDGAMHEIADTHHRSVFFLAPFTQLTRSQTVRFLRRGRYHVGSVSLTAGDLFGFTVASKQLETGAFISVYPRLLAVQETAYPSSRWQGDLLVKRWIVPDPFLVGGIREWRHGDTLRDVHWAATARTGNLQIKAHDYTAAPKLLVILNVQKDEHQWADLMEYEQDTIEYGISLAATLCIRALQGGLEAGFAANAPMDGTDGTTVLLPSRYTGRDLDILEAMARLRVLRTRNFFTFLGDLSQLTGTDILILSVYDSPLIAERMETLRRRGNSVALWKLQPG
ncbi:MAG: DUF58 domain-containing protein [Clostridia bacterium]|nr:DUF58 domain-containing protein [Clostridia bacterium]